MGEERFSGSGGSSRGLRGEAGEAVGCVLGYECFGERGGAEKVLYVRYEI